MRLYFAQWSGAAWLLGFFSICGSNFAGIASWITNFIGILGIFWSKSSPNNVVHYKTFVKQKSNIKRFYSCLSDEMARTLVKIELK